MLIFKCDTGADISVMSKKTCPYLPKEYGHKHLDPNDGLLTGFGGGTAKIHDIATLWVWHAEKSYPVDFKSTIRVT